jgi:hypothetical protein
MDAPEEIAHRLREHVDRILADAHVPVSDRGDIAAELYGHLVEAWRSLVDRGIPPATAMRHAIRNFGAARPLGRQLPQSYHSRAWASTIGVLLPTDERVDERPPVVTLVSFTLLVAAMVIGVAAIAIAANRSPLQAILVIVLGVMNVAGILLARAGLERAFPWALTIAWGVLLVMGAEGVYTWLRSEGHTYSITGIMGALLLVILLLNRAEVREWLVKAPAQDGRSLAIAALVFGPWLLMPLGLALPDPTQASSGDLHLSASMTCDPNAQTGSITARFSWDRVPLLPGGVAHVSGYGDMLVAELPTTLAWVYDYPFVRDVATQEVVGEPNLLPPYGTAVESFHPEINAPALVGIEIGKVRAGHIYELTWPVDFIRDAEGVEASIEYWHLDRFRTELVIDCSGTVMDQFTDESLPSIDSLAVN